MNIEKNCQKRIESERHPRLIRAGYSWTLSRYRYTWRLLAVPLRAWTRTPLIKQPRAQITTEQTLC